MSTPSDNIPQQPPANLPIDPRVFFCTPVGVTPPTLVAHAEPTHVLEQLGPPSFRKSSFPLIGFLSGLYEHVAAHVSGDSKS